LSHFSNVFSILQSSSLLQRLCLVTAIRRSEPNEGIGWVTDFWARTAWRRAPWELEHCHSEESNYWANV
jgi:hypothetical protein